MELVTIDGEDARDFDDAVWCERKSGGWRVIVAIADVAHYVRPGSPLDVEARERGTSVYFPNRVLPMLPEALSNGLCSLKPDEDRLCLCCELRVGDDGRITRSRFFEGVMRSVARLTYRDVGEFLEKPAAKHAPKLERLRERLLALHGVYKSFIRARSGRGALELDTPELKLKFDEQGKVAALVEYPRNDAHRLIEECMIAANVAAARFLDRYKVPTLYRVHGLPELDRLETLRTFLREFGLWLPAPDEVTPEHLRDLLQKIGDRPDAGLISTAVIRTMPQAVYQPGNIGHFGLALEHYAHFTSPIRRYPDLVVHRGIRQVLREGDPQELIEWHGQFPVLGQDCSFRERRADEATRSAVAWLKCFYMQDRIGEEFDGIVSGVVDFGLFVQLDGLQVDGLLHVSALGAGLFRPRQFGLPHDRPQLGQDLQARRSRAGARDERLARRPARGFRTRWCDGNTAQADGGALPAPGRRTEASLMPRRHDPRDARRAGGHGRRAPDAAGRARDARGSASGAHRRATSRTASTRCASCCSVHRSACGSCGCSSSRDCRASPAGTARAGRAGRDHRRRCRRRATRQARRRRTTPGCDRRNRAARGRSRDAARGGARVARRRAAAAARARRRHGPAQSGRVPAQCRRRRRRSRDRAA